MSDIASFIRTGSGRIDVTIGSHAVAAIRRQGRTVRYGFSLPDLGVVRTVDSIEKARSGVLQKLADWFRDLGPPGAATAVLLDQQAERERRAAA